MSRTSIYLNFMGKTEEAFHFYREVFGGEFTMPIQYMRDVPHDPSQPELPEAEKNMVMHVELPILGGALLMGTDTLDSMGHKLSFGNNISINLEPDTRAETQALYAKLLAGGSELMPLQDMFWGDLYGTGVDKYGVRWMFDCREPKGDA